MKSMGVSTQQIPPPGGLFVDHVSHFVPDLGAAARALEALGFAVTPESAQQTQDGPAGTSNVCVMLEQGYLEFLAPTADTPNAQRLRTTMQRYPGVHLCCFGTPDAEGEHTRLQAHGFEPLPLVHLSREVQSGIKAQFKVVRAAPSKMPEGRIQFVQHQTPEHLWRAQYLGHTNNVVKLACVFVVADDPADCAARWAEFAALLPRPAGGYVHLQASRGPAGARCSATRPRPPPSPAARLNAATPRSWSHAAGCSAWLSGNCAKIFTRSCCPNPWAARGSSELDKDWDCQHEKRPLRALRDRTARALPEE
jgi:hypothetical protein